MCSTASLPCALQRPSRAGRQYKCCPTPRRPSWTLAIFRLLRPQRPERWPPFSGGLAKQTPDFPPLLLCGTASCSSSGSASQINSCALGRVQVNSGSCSRLCSPDCRTLNTEHATGSRAALMIGIIRNLAAVLLLHVTTCLLSLVVTRTCTWQSFTAADKGLLGEQAHAV